MPTNTRSKKPSVSEQIEEEPIEETGSKDVETLNPEPDVVELSSGSSVRVKPIKTRETFALLRIVSRGAGPILAEVAFNREDQDAFTGQLIGLLIMAIPEAVDESIDFVRVMVEPDHPSWVEKPRTKAQRNNNEELLTALYEELENPELDDLIAIITAIAINEAPHMMALGKRLAALFEQISGRVTKSLTKD